MPDLFLQEIDKVKSATLNSTAVKATLAVRLCFLTGALLCMTS